MPAGHRRKPVPLRISGSVALVAKPEGASHTAGTALSTCIPVAMLAAWACSAMLALRVKLASVRKCDAHRRVALDGQRPAVLGRGPVLRVLVADGPQRLDLDAAVRRRGAPPVPALPRRRARPQQTVEDLVVSLRGDGFDVDGDLVDVGVERIGQEPDLFDEDRLSCRAGIGRRRAMISGGSTERHVAEADAGALVERQVGALLQGDLVDRAAHPRQRQRQDARQVARVEAAGVKRAAAVAACRRQPFTVGIGQPGRIEQEDGRGDVLAAGQQPQTSSRSPLRGV